MITREELKTSSRAYLRAARVLNRAGNNSADAAAYLCGYAVEIALKARICRTLGWVNYPISRDYSSFKVHDLGVLLHLSGVEVPIKTDPALATDWSIVIEWDPQQRYDPIGTRTTAEAGDMIDATRRLLGKLLW